MNKTSDAFLAWLRKLPGESGKIAADEIERLRSDALRLPGEEGHAPKVVAARILGLQYGDPGPRLPDDICSRCYGERYVWLGNCWGVKHIGDGQRCSCSCHIEQVWLANAGDRGVSLAEIGRG